MWNFAKMKRAETEEKNEEVDVFIVTIFENSKEVGFEF
jgi:hypothetical protein